MPKFRPWMGEVRTSWTGSGATVRRYTREMADFLAFDFDGVVCDSARETALTAWRAAHGLWPDRVAAEPDAGALARFVRLRPVIETGYENLALVLLVVRGVDDDEVLRHFDRLCDALLRDEGLDRAVLRRRFGAARDEWLDTDVESWLAAQGFYPGVVDAINAARAPCCIVTTKEERFTRVLVERAGLDVPPDRIYALESFEGAGKGRVLDALALEHPRLQLHFFEDRLATLERVGERPRLRRYLADWGYNTEAERARARADPGIEVLDAAGFSRVVAAADAP